jgi:hypothetical protein
MTATATPTATRARGTAKTIRTAGINLNQPLMYFPDHNKRAYGEGTRFESIGCDRRGVYGVQADGTKSPIGGVATVFWVVVEETPAPAPVVRDYVREQMHRTLANHAAKTRMDREYIAAEAAAAGDELDGLTFAELMVIAKALKVPGRGTARIDALREGIRAARAAA